MANLDKKNIRYNILTIIVYVIGIILIVQLFNLQIVHGKEYLEQANGRLTRELTIKAARGNIIDTNGNIMAGTTIKYALELYKSKINTETLNNTILQVLNVLEKNGDTYIDSFPININPIQYKYEGDDEKINNWLDSNDLEENLTAEQALNSFIEEYELADFVLEDARKIIAVRYGITQNGYSSMRAYIISSNISAKSVAEIEEKNAYFPGTAIDSTPLRTYKYGSLASHIVGYVGSISESEYKNNKGYSLNDYIGKTGIEYSLEKYLKGADGKKQIDMSIDGTTTAEYITEEAIGGNDVILTIDAKIQSVAETALKDNIEKINNGGFGRVYQAKTGSAVVMNVKTGEVIAMCSCPDFEPELFTRGISTEKWNEYTQEGKSALINRTIQGTYAPGSIYKMVSAVAGLQTGAITADEKILCSGVYSGGHNPVCWYWTSYGAGHRMARCIRRYKEFL